MMHTQINQAISPGIRDIVISEIQIIMGTLLLGQRTLRLVRTLTT